MQPSALPNLTDRILVVDDDVNFHRLAETALAEAKLACVCVRSGEEASKLLAGSVPKAILVDGLLPGVRGDEFARRLRKQYSAELLPIVFVSAFYRDMKSYRLLTQECGVDLVLHKPVQPSLLRKSIEKLLRMDEPVPSPFEVELEVDAPSRGLGLGEEVEELEEDFEDEVDSPEMVQLRAEYLANSKERAQELRSALGTLSGPAGEDALHMIRVETHRFRGSGSSFGFPEISRLGGAAEELIVENDGLLRSGALRARLTGLVEALADKVLAAAGTAPIAAARRGGGVPRVLLFDPGTSLARAAAAAEEKDQPISVVADLDEALRAAIEQRPDVVFVALEGAELATACARFKAASSGPVVVFGRVDRVEDWVAAVQAGAVGYVARPPDVEGLFRIASVYARPRVSSAVLAVGGDRSSLSGLAEMLAPKGVAVEPCATTEEFFGALERSSPSMVVLDGDLPKVKGIDLLRVLRADLRWRSLPVMIVSRLGGLQERLAAFEAGAVDWIARPVPADELVVRVLAQLARAGAVDPRRRGTDPVTGLWDRESFREALGRALQLGRREGRTVAVLAIDAGFDELRKAHGRLAADEALIALGTRLVSVFRTSDVVARMGPSRLVALLHGASKADAERLLGIELKELRARSFAGGWKPEPMGAVAVFPEVTGGPDELLVAVESKLAH